MSYKKSKYPSVYLEWLLSIEVILLFATLGIISLVFCWETIFFSEKKEEILEKQFFISFEGAVEKNIILQCSSPVRFKKILYRIKPKENADLLIYPKNRRIQSSLAFFIPEKGKGETPKKKTKRK